MIREDETVYWNGLGARVLRCSRVQQKVLIRRTSAPRGWPARRAGACDVCQDFCQLIFDQPTEATEPNLAIHHSEC